MIRTQILHALIQGFRKYSLNMPKSAEWKSSPNEAINHQTGQDLCSCREYNTAKNKKEEKLSSIYGNSHALQRVETLTGFV